MTQDSSGTGTDTAPEEEIPLKVEITNKDKIIEKNPTSVDTQSPYDEMDLTDEDIEAYMEDINAQ